MKIGLIAYSSQTGLGYQTYDFAKNIGCTKILIADLHVFNRMPVDHKKFDKLCDDIRITNGMPSRQDAHWITDDIDLLFVCETPLNYDIFDMARDKGVKTVLQYNYEFLEYYRKPSLPKPDLLASPSYWNIEDTKQRGFAPVEYLPVPMDFTGVEPRIIKTVKRIGHIGGRVADHDRNGTKLFLDFATGFAQTTIFDDKLPFDRSEIIFELYMQLPKDGRTEKNFHEIKPILDEAKNILGERLEVRFDVPNNRDMYRTMDLMILPRRYGGLCLPLWESLAHGIPVMMPKIDPNDKVLPSEWTTLAMEYGTLNTHSKIPMYQVDMGTLMLDVINVVADIESHNQTAYNMADEMGWDNMREKYYRLFQSLVDNEYEVQS